MKIRELGEFGLLEELSRVVKEAGVGQGPDLLLGIGDDASAWLSLGRVELLTTDILVEGVHFDLKTTSWRELGWKSLAVNLSDIAAMGGQPSQAVISLGLPEDVEVEQVLELYQGMIGLAKEFNLLLSGGDLTASPMVIISPTVAGYGKEGQLLTRSGARPGQLIGVTGYLGSAAAGLQMLREGLEFDPEITLYLRQAHLHPVPRIAEAQKLVQEGIRVAIDVSDGLVADLRHICQASGVEAEVEAENLPVHPLVRSAFGEASLRLALAGGEDYELIFVGEEEKIQRVRQQMSTPVSIVGRILPGEAGKVKVLHQGSSLGELESGWEHFKSGKATWSC